MAFCTQCGAQLSEADPFCTVCGAPNDYYDGDAAGGVSGSDMEARNLEQSFRSSTANMSDAFATAATAAKSAATSFKAASEEAHRETVERRNQSRNVTLSDGEQIVRSYCCAKMVTPKCDGYLTVTNKRILFEGRGGASRVTQETWLSGVSGINAFYGWDIQVLRLIIGIALAIFGIIQIRESVLLGLVLLIVGGLFIWSALLKCFKLEIRAGDCMGNPISLGSSPVNRLGNGAMYTLKGRPTEDTDRMMNELGALVQDLQTMGDLAIKKWQ